MSLLLLLAAGGFIAGLLLAILTELKLAVRRWLENRNRKP